MAIFTFTNIAVAAMTLYITRRLYWEATTGLRRRALAKQHGCLPAKYHQTPFTFGALFWWGQIKAIKEHCLLPYMSNNFREVNRHTRRHFVFGTHFITTEDSENVKAVLATNFGAWSLGQERIQEMSSYLGYGIFVNEGAAWKHSREMLRPCFERSQVADVDILERHTQRLLDLVPKDGTTIDLQPLLHDFSMDAATELLFGKGTNALSRAGDNNETKDFCDAFEYASNPFERETFKKWGAITLFLPERFQTAKKRHVKVMQGTFTSDIVLYTVVNKNRLCRPHHRRTSCRFERLLRRQVTLHIPHCSIQRRRRTHKDSQRTAQHPPRRA